MRSRQLLSGDKPDHMHLAARMIQSGGLVAFPTETVYGLGADALNPDAVEKIFAAKKRPAFDPLIIHIAELETLMSLVMIDLQHRALLMALVESFWPGPLTLVLPRRSVIPDVVTAGLPTVAIRMPAHPIALALIREAGTPIAAPSANPFGYVSPTAAHHVVEGLGDHVDLILDGGACSLGVESTIISFANGSPRLLRAGSLPVEDLEEIIGPILRHGFDEAWPLSPGQLARHYATRTPLYLLPTSEAIPRFVPSEQNGLLAFAPPRRQDLYTAVEILSPTGNVQEAAHNFFAALRRLDGQGLTQLWAEPCSEDGIGMAIMDRLRRCAVQKVNSHYPEKD
ncbi:MAG: threonylcarbamoyl-AMP synthase [Nitrospirales bacterium]|nr:threonylcarbamoyl-AMP synthase [Nitrospirales bacterium]